MDVINPYCLLKQVKEKDLTETKSVEYQIKLLKNRQTHINQYAQFQMLNK